MSFSFVSAAGAFPILIFIEETFLLFPGVVLGRQCIHLRLELVLLINERLKSLARFQFKLLNALLYFLNFLVDSVDLFFFARILHHYLDLADFLSLLLKEVLVRVLLSAYGHEVLLFILLTVQYEFLHIPFDA